MNINKASRIILIVGILVSEIILVPATVRGFSYEDTADFISRIFSFSIAFFGAYAIFKLLSDKKPRAIVLASAALISIIALLTILLIGFGLLQDNLGVQCVGFLGASITCVSNYSLTAFVLALNPITLGILSAVSVAALFIQTKSDLTKTKQLS